MERVSRFRARIVLIFFVLVMGFYAFRLYDIQIIETGGTVDNTTTFVTRTRVKAARGDILDRNGNVLVSNRASYDLTINHYVLLQATGTNNYLYQLTKVCQQQGIEYAEHFPISEQRPFTYTLSEQSSAWQGYFQSYLAHLGGLDSDITAPLLIERLRDFYNLPATWTDEEARKVIGLYYEMNLRQCTSLPVYVFVTDADNDALSAVVELNIPGMNVEASTVREYNTKYAAHILGYVGAMSASQWEYYKTVDGYDMDAEVGQDGLEAAYEEYLHGIDGWREDETALDGTLISSRYITEPQAGSNVEISIDITLQMAAEDQMAQVIEQLRANPDADGWDAEGGAVVAMDVTTGQILACASYPTYDLSSFHEDYAQLCEDPYKPIYNRALLATYPPGSTYKMTMVVAAMEKGVIKSKTTITDYGVYDRDGSGNDKYKNFEVSCHAWTSSHSTHGTINAAEALRDSCNYFFYSLGDRMRIQDIDAVGKSLGLGEKSGVELSEYTGYRANPETKEELHSGEDKNWYTGDTILAAIGQSEHRYTPMQLCVYTATLANQGTRYKATFLNRVVSADYRQLLAESSPEIVSTVEISDETYNTLKEGMHMVVSEVRGTAYKVFKNYPIALAAKTGTAQTGISGASDNGSFVCFGPLDDPQIAIAVYVEKGGHGSTLATIAKAILDIYFEVGEIGDVTTYENQLS